VTASTSSFFFPFSCFGVDASVMRKFVSFLSSFPLFPGFTHSGLNVIKYTRQGSPFSLSAMMKARLPLFLFLPPPSFPAVTAQRQSPQKMIGNLSLSSPSFFFFSFFFSLFVPDLRERAGESDDCWCVLFPPSLRVQQITLLF